MSAEGKDEKHVVRKIFRIVSKIISVILLLVIIFEVTMGILNMQRLNNNQDPIWYLDVDSKTEGDKKETTYNLGLYVIEKVEEKKEIKISLKPFFLK